MDRRVNRTEEACLSTAKQTLIGFICASASSSPRRWSLSQVSPSQSESTTVLSTLNILRLGLNCQRPVFSWVLATPSVQLGLRYHFPVFCWVLAIHSVLLGLNYQSPMFRKVLAIPNVLLGLNYQFPLFCMVLAIPNVQVSLNYQSTMFCWVNPQSSDGS